MRISNRRAMKRHHHRRFPGMVSTWQISFKDARRVANGQEAKAAGEAYSYSERRQAGKACRIRRVQQILLHNHSAATAAGVTTSP
jgi:hypothetical protein